MKFRNFAFAVAVSFGMLTNSNFAVGETIPVTNTTELLDALYTAANNSEDDTIRIAQGTYTGEFVHSATTADNLVIEGGWNANFSGRNILASNTILDGGGVKRVLGIVGSGNVTVEGVTLRNGTCVSGTGGGGLYVNTPGGDVIVRSCNINNNISGSAGGGGMLILSAGGDVTLTGNLVASNNGSTGGGASIQAGTGRVTLVDNDFSGNSATGSGGAVYIATAGLVEITTNSIVDNVTTGGSGGIVVNGANTITGGSVTVSGNDFRGNRSQLDYNGTLYIIAREVTVDGNHIANNLRGYGVLLEIYGNSSYGAIGKILNNLITDNALGGGVRIDGGSSLDSVSLINNVISANSYTRNDRGGGIDYFPAVGHITLINNTISHNTTGGSGGGIRILASLDNSILQLHSNIIYNNSLYT